MKFGWIPILVCAVWLVARQFVALPSWVHLAGFFCGLVGVLLVYSNRKNSAFWNGLSEFYLTYAIAGLPNLLGSLLGLLFLTSILAFEYFDRGTFSSIYGVPTVWLTVVLAICWWVWTLYVVLIWKKWKRREGIND